MTEPVTTPKSPIPERPCVVCHRQHDLGNACEDVAMPPAPIPKGALRAALSKKINALPEWVRQYIHDIETKCDPAGDIRTITELRDTIRALEAEHSGPREALEALKEMQPFVKALAQLDVPGNPADVAVRRSEAAIAKIEEMRDAD